MSEPIDFDPVSKAVVQVIEDSGHKVDVRRDGETYRCTATHPEEGTRSSVGSDLQRTMSDLAEKVGIELEDG